jgi:flagellar protein FlaH
MVDHVYGIGLERDELAGRLGGGLPKGAIVLIEGEEGSGRSVISQRMAYGLLRSGHTVSYISTEMTMKDFIDQMYSLEYRIGEFLPNLRLLYIPVYPLIGKTMPREDFLDKLMKSPQLYRNDVVFIDSLSTLGNKQLDEQNCNILLGLFKKLVGIGKTMVLTIENGQEALDPLRLASDVYLVLRSGLVGEEISRTVNVKRYIRARGKVNDVIRYRIEPNIGLVIELTEVSG